MKIRIKDKTWIRRACVLVTLVIFSGCAGYKKVMVDYRQKALAENHESKILIIGPFYQKCENFQAVTDFIRYLQRELEKNSVFRSIEIQFDIRNFQNDLKSAKDHIEKLKEIDWMKAYADFEADLLLAGVVQYDTKDRSGYDSEWQETRYGLRTAKKVYRDRLLFDLELGLLLVDLKSGKILFENTYIDKDLAEGQADEIALFFELIDKQVKKFMDEILGKQIRSKRYLLYD
ncbi:MAG: hypothetical protein WBM02_02135 [bacterium]